MLYEAGARAHGGGFGSESLAGPDNNSVMNADEEFAVGALGALRAEPTMSTKASMARTGLAEET